jgi:predicted nucleic acid-binding protein
VKPDEEGQLEYFLSGFRNIVLTGQIAEIAGRYLNKYRKSHGINMADAIIAATAKLTDSKLYTLNTKHYPMSDIEVIKPY